MKPIFYTKNELDSAKLDLTIYCIVVCGHNINSGMVYKRMYRKAAKRKGLKIVK